MSFRVLCCARTTICCWPGRILRQRIARPSIDFTSRTTTYKYPNLSAVLNCDGFNEILARYPFASFMDVSSVSKYGDHSVNDLLDTLIDIRLGGTQCEDVWDMV